MDLIVYLNGNFVKANEAKVSVYDHSFLYGDGVFETMRAYKRCVFKFEDHVRRLYNSLKQIYMDLPIAPNMMLKAIKLLLQYNQLSDAYIRIMVSRGEGPIGLDISFCPNPTLFIVVEQPHNYPTNWYQHGVSTIIVSHRHIPDVCLSTSIKSCNYLINILARKEVQDKGAQEALMLNMEGYLTEGTVSNVFLSKNRKILTPALTSGILDGITRKTVIEIAEHRGIEVMERHVLPEEIFSADECFITNTTMEILPVTFCDGTQIGDGKPGRLTKILMKDYRRVVDNAISAEKE